MRVAIALLLVPLLFSGCTTTGPAPTFETLDLPGWKARLEATTAAFLLDVRTLEEFEQGHLPNATLVPYDQISATTPELPQDKATPIFVYCRSGNRSGIASETLVGLGYETVVNLRGGYPDWAAAGHPTA